MRLKSLLESPPACLPAPSRSCTHAPHSVPHAGGAGHGSGVSEPQQPEALPGLPPGPQEAHLPGEHCKPTAAHCHCDQCMPSRCCSGSPRLGTPTGEKGKGKESHELRLQHKHVFCCLLPPHRRATRCLTCAASEPSRTSGQRVRGVVGELLIQTCCMSSWAAHESPAVPSLA